MRRTAQLDIITRAIQDVIPGCTSTAFLTVRVEESDAAASARHSWNGTVRGLAERVHTALYGNGQASAKQVASPVQQAEDAKRMRDLVGGIGVLLDAGHALESAPWYPARAGDVVHVHYEQAGTVPECGETYLVQDVPDGGGLLRMRLVAHSHTEDSDQPGAFESVGTDDPLFELWFEAGPHRLTVVRHGRVVHDGPNAATRA